MNGHLNDLERTKGNKSNDKGIKTLKNMNGEITFQTPQDRQSSFAPQIVKKRKTVLAENLAPKIIGLTDWG